MLPSNAPTNLSVVPIPGVGVEVRATFHQANGVDGTYVRFEVSTEDDFASTDYDSDQVAITPVADENETIMVFPFIPVSAGTYYYRLCFWDDVNYTKTTWLVWNGTVVSTTPKTGTIRPSGDSSVAIETVFPSSPTTHFDKVDEITENEDTDYVQTLVTTGGGTKDQTDLYNLENLSDNDFVSIDSIVPSAYAKNTHYEDGRVIATLKIKTHGILYTMTAGGMGETYILMSHIQETNPFTTVAWTLDEIQDLIVAIKHWIDNPQAGTIALRTTQIFITINYNIYTFIFTPPGDNILSIGFPSVSSVEINNDKDKYTFNVVISDTYSKLPIVTLTTGNDTEVMDYVKRTGGNSSCLEVLGSKIAYKDIDLKPGDTLEFDMWVIEGAYKLCDFFFLCDENGAGQMFRFEARGGANYSGFASTTSWYVWAAPASGFPVNADTWYHIKLVFGTTTVEAFVDGISKGTYAFVNNGGYIAISGDGGIVAGGLFDSIFLNGELISDGTSLFEWTIRGATINTANGGTDINYAYTFSKTVSLERGDFEYHIEIGNVWTVIIDDIRFLHTNYNLNQDPKIEIFVGNQKIETWNHSLMENILPDLPEIEFDSSENIQSFDVTVRFIKNDFKEYNMEIQGTSKTSEGYHIRAREIANRDLEQVITFASQAVNSLTLLKSLLPGYIFIGDLTEMIYLQAFLNEKIADIFKRLLILNHAISYVRNKKIYLYDLGNTDALFKMNVMDAQIGYASDPSVIVNKVREYYVRKMYPVPENIFTNYDAANWLGTVINAVQTVNGILPLSGSLYCLKATGDIYRVIDFLWSDFDQLNMNWCPDVAMTLEIRLETDADNYRKYIRTFSGQKGSGFVLTSSLPTDVVTKTLSFADKYINIITGTVTKLCSYKIELKLDGVVVSTMDWDSTTGYFGKAFANVLCDTIEISFTNLYPVGTTYGVNCSNLTIEEYKQIYEIISTMQKVLWHSRYAGSAGLNFTYDAPSLTWSGTAHEEYGAVSPLIEGEFYEIKVNHCYIYASLGKPKVGGGIEWTNFHLGVGISVGIDERGILVADFSCSYALEDPAWVINLGAASYSFDVNKVINDYVGEWVWEYFTYDWAEVYNLWDSLSIPFSQFTTVGTPTNQINTIRLITANDNWYDTIYFIKNTPVPQYVEAENIESMAKGIKFQERKLDGWSSKESALAFAKAFVNLFGEPAESYSKQMSMTTDISIGDMVDCDGTILPVYKISYDLKAGQMTVFVGRSVTDTIEWLKETSRKIEAIEKTIY